MGMIAFQVDITAFISGAKLRRGASDGEGSTDRIFYALAAGRRTRGTLSLSMSRLHVPDEVGKRKKVGCQHHSVFPSGPPSKY